MIATASVAATATGGLTGCRCNTWDQARSSAYAIGTPGR